MPGEQGARGHREIGATGLAAPARLIVRAATIIADLAAAMRTDRLAVGLRPAQAQEHVLRAASDIRMTLPGLSERAAADKRKCCAMRAAPTHGTYSEHDRAQALVKPGGGCYIISEKRDMLFHSVWGGSPRPSAAVCPVSASEMVRESPI